MADEVEPITWKAIGVAMHIHKTKKKQQKKEEETTKKQKEDEGEEEKRKGRGKSNHVLQENIWTIFIHASTNNIHPATNLHFFLCKSYIAKFPKGFVGRVLKCVPAIN